MKNLILILCCLTFIFMSVITVYATAPKVTDNLQTEYYSFKMVYQMLLIEKSKEELISRLPSELKFLVVTLKSKEKMKRTKLSKALARSITRFAENVRGDVSEPYVIQGIDKFIDYMNGSTGKTFYQIYQEILEKPIESLTKANNSGSLVDVKATKELKKFEILGNYPNPFNPETTIEYTLHQESFVKVAIYNIRGQEISILVNGKQEQGIKKVQWDGKNSRGKSMPSGHYFYRFEIDGHSKEIGKMIYVK